MKRTLRTLVMAISCIALSCTTAFADNDKPIKFGELPANARTTITKHFSKQKVALTTRETGIGNNDYNVVLQNGTKIEFNNKGVWTEVDCKRNKVPAALIPQQIRTYMLKNYPGTHVTKIEKKRNGYEIDLSNGIDITFNNQFQVTKID